MNRDQIARLRRHYRDISPGATVIVDRFFDLLLSQHPEVRPLFPADLTHSKTSLVAALGLICRNLDRLDLLEGSLHELGIRHARLGVRPDHYPMVRDALVQALSEYPNGDWTATLADDWNDLLNVVSGVMLRGAARAVIEAAREFTRTGRTRV